MQKQKIKLARISSAASAIFFTLVAASPSAFGQWKVSTYDNTGLPKKALADIIANVAYWLLGVFGFIAVIGFVISGIMYLVSSGDEDGQERAKRAMYYSITGVIVGLVGLVVIYAVQYFLSGGGGVSYPAGASPNSAASGAI